MSRHSKDGSRTGQAPVRGAELERCMRECMSAYRACIEAEARCLEAGGRHAEVGHLQLLRDCAAICRLSADFLLRASPRHVLACALCAGLCLQCAEDCGRFERDGKMKRCAEACRACAAACAELTRV